MKEFRAPEKGQVWGRFIFNSTIRNRQTNRNINEGSKDYRSESKLPLQV